MNSTHYTKSYVHRGNRGNIETRTLRSGEQYLQGTVRTPYGMVEVLASESDSPRAYFRLDFIYRGRHWIRFREGVRSSAVGLTQRAGRFAFQVSKGEGNCE